MKTRLALVALMAALALPALADEPGPGGSRPPVPKDGADLYRIYCQVCHMPDARGAAGAGMFPALAGNARLGTAQYAIYLVAKGKGGMPNFNESLSAGQIADVVNYIRTYFGNDYKDAVTAQDVEPMAKPPSSGRH